MASHDDDEEAPNAVEQFRKEHPNPYDQVAGDLMPGSLMARDAYRRTADGAARFWRVTPAPRAPDPKGRVRRIVTVSSWVLVVLATSTVLLLLAATRPLGLLGWTAVVLDIAAAVVLVAGGWRLRRERRQNLLVGQQEDGLGAADPGDRDGGGPRPGQP